MISDEEKESALKAVKDVRKDADNLSIINAVKDFFRGTLFFVGYDQGDKKGLEVIVFCEELKTQKIFVFANQYEFYQFLSGKYNEHTSQPRAIERIWVPAVVALTLLGILFFAVHEKETEMLTMLMPMATAAVGFYFGAVKR